MFGLLLGLLNIGGAAAGSIKKEYEFSSYNNNMNSNASSYSFEELQRKKETATNDSEWWKWRNIEIRKFSREIQKVENRSNGRSYDMISGRPCYFRNDSIQGFCLYDGDRHCFLRKVAKPWSNSKESIILTKEEYQKELKKELEREWNEKLKYCEELCKKDPMFFIKNEGKEKVLMMKNIEDYYGGIEGIEREDNKYIRKPIFISNIKYFTSLEKILNEDYRKKFVYEKAKEEDIANKYDNAKVCRNCLGEVELVKE